MHKKNVGIIIPTYNRPQMMKKNVENIFEVTDMSDVDIIFVVEEDDKESIEAGHDLDAIVLINQRTRGYAGANNTASRTLTHNYFYTANDDFFFHENWLPPLLELSENFGVVSPNDLGNPSSISGTMGTSFLVSRTYLPLACVDSSGDLFHEGYIHNFCDNEITETAKSHGQFVSCPVSLVEHLHPAFGKSIEGLVYERQADAALFEIDRTRFESRRNLWGHY
jgi:glycosyltransferase involved in cell wall biosynthesis